MAIGASKGVSYIGMIGNEHIPKTAAHVDHTMIRDTAYSSAHATAQHTGLQLETMSQALFRGLF